MTDATARAAASSAQDDVDGLLFRFPASGRWEDVPIPVSSLAKGANAPSLTKVADDSEGVGVYAYTFENGKRQDVYSDALQVPHGRLPGSAFHIHFHWSTYQAGAGSLIFGVALQVMPNYNDGDGYGTWSTVSVTKVTVNPAPTGADRAGITEIVVVPGTGIEESALFRLRCSRYGNEDSYNKPVVIDSVDPHILKDRAGSVLEYGDPD